MLNSFIIYSKDDIPFPNIALPVRVNKQTKSTIDLQSYERNSFGEMKVQDVLNCSFNSWYEKFRKCTIKSIVLTLPHEVLVYMQDNGTLVLPEGSQPEVNYERDTEDSSDVEDWDHCEQSGTTAQIPQLHDFNEMIKDAIQRLGGSAFPKLNWSSPKDASWIALNNSLRCSTPGDVYLLLKSSNFVTHDLSSPFKDCDDCPLEEDKIAYVLVLRRWMEINPGHEFRCFVRNKDLIGISQRDISQSYSFIRSDKKNILGEIVSFWKENIENRFPSPSYVFDVYRPAKDKIILIDFNPFGETTDSLLFDWDHLLQRQRQDEESAPRMERIIEEETEEDFNIVTDPNIRNLQITLDSNRRNEENQDMEEPVPDFRFITDDTGVQPSPYMQYGLPLDIIDLSTGQDPYKLVDFIQMAVQNPGHESSDEETVDES